MILGSINDSSVNIQKVKQGEGARDSNSIAVKDATPETHTACQIGGYICGDKAEKWFYRVDCAYKIPLMSTETIEAGTHPQTRGALFCLALRSEQLISDSTEVWTS